MDITVRPMSAGDLDDADRIMRLAFGTFNGLEDPNYSSSKTISTF